MNNLQIIAVDLAKEDSKDYSTTSSICTKCRSVIETKTYKSNENGIGLTRYKNCPVCGVKFSKHKIMEETYECR